jgi:hypothetical protein
VDKEHGIEHDDRDVAQAPLWSRLGVCLAEQVRFAYATT